MRCYVAPIREDFMRRFAILAAAAVLPLTLAAAQTTPNPIDCARANSTVEMNYCAERDFAEADRLLNEAYSRALAQIAASDNPAPYAPAAWEKEFRAAQRAWITFRDADCKGVVPMEWSGGTGTSAAVLGCMIELTKARANDLAERYGKR
jgi:uncharacterized protein YecT (DUF1311 family)